MNVGMIMNVSNRNDTEMYFSMPYPVPCIFTGLLTVVGNSFVICAVLKYPRLQTATNVFVCSLASADLLLGCTYFSFSMCYFVNRYHRTEDSDVGLVAAVLSLLFNFLFISASVLSLLAVSLERYAAILHPYWYTNNVNRFWCIVVTGISWIFSIMYAFPLFIVFLQPLGEQRVFFNQVAVIDEFFIGILAILVFISIIWIYSRIWKVARQHSLKIACHDKQNSASKETKTAKIIFIVVGLYFVSFVPIICISAYLMHQKPALFGSEYPTGEFICLSIAVACLNLNSMINPIIYAWLNTDFRVAFKEIISRILCRQNNSVS